MRIGFTLRRVMAGRFCSIQLQHVHTKNIPDDKSIVREEFVNQIRFAKCFLPTKGLYKLDHLSF